MTYYVLVCRIRLGEYVFDQCVNVEITKSVDTLSDTAVIRMPTAFILGNENDGFTRRKLESAIRAGIPVSIELGYEGLGLREEFSGYVKSVKPNTPLEIECEDAMYLLRQKSCNKNFQKTTLKDVLLYIVDGTGVELADGIPEVNFDKFLLKNVNGAAALQKIKSHYGLSVYIDNGKLFAGLRQQTKKGDVSYALRKVVGAGRSGLKFRTEEDRKIRIKAISILPDNSKIEAEAGDPDGELRTLHFRNVSDKAELERMATERLATLKYEGYEGHIASYLHPFAQPGMSAKVSDANYPDRGGDYFIPKVVTTFGNGARRKVHLGNKL